MSESVQLVLLRCPECSSNLAGGKEGVFLYCGGCGAGYRFIENKLQKVPVYFARTNENPGAFLPFWAFDATLEVRTLDANRGLKAIFKREGGLGSVFQERGTLRFYVSAFQGDLDAIKPRALQLTINQPELEYIDHQQRVDGFTVALEDAEKVADFLFMTSEIEQPDMMRKMDYSLQLTNPIVVVIGM